MENITTNQTTPPSNQRLPYGNRHNPPNFKKIGAIAALLLIIIAIPLTIFLSRQEQDIRQEASVTANSTESNVCSAGNTDTFLVIDRSNSMRNPTSNTNKTPRINFARSAAIKFVNIMSQETTNHIGVAQFGRNGGTPLNYTNNYEQVRNTIRSLAPDGPIGTCLECAVLAVNDRVRERIKSGKTNKKFVIILSDGNANIVKNADGSINPDINQERGIKQARQAILAGHKSSGTIFYTIGLGQERNAEGRAFLRDVATATGGKYYFAANAAQLESIYQQIALTMGKGSISGSVLDNDSQKLQGWDVLLKRMPEDKEVGKITTGTDGAYTFTSLCNSAYKVELTLKDGFTLISPTNPNYFELDVSKGEIHTGKDFIVSQATNEPTDEPTATPSTEPSSTPSATTAPDSKTLLNISVLLHGIGASGDNVLLRPTQCQRTASESASTECLSNQNPLHPEREALVEFLDQNNQTMASVSGMITYDNSIGGFRGAVDLGDSWTTGPYLIKFTTPRNLKRQVAGLHTITAGQEYELPEFDVVSSDVDSDNRLTVLDYSMIIACYTFPGVEPTCDSEKATIVDVDDDGDNDEFDYNLFLRDLSVQYGD